MLEVLVIGKLVWLDSVEFIMSLSQRGGLERGGFFVSFPKEGRGVVAVTLEMLVDTILL